MDIDEVNNDPILRLPEVEVLTGRKSSSIYEDMAAGRLPQSVKIGPRSVGWFRSDILSWQAKKAKEREALRLQNISKSDPETASALQNHLVVGGTSFNGSTLPTMLKRGGSKQ